VLVSVNTRLGREEVVHTLRHSGARMVFVDNELVHLVDAAGLPGDPTVLVSSHVPS